MTDFETSQEQPRKKAFRPSLIILLLLLAAAVAALVFDYNAKTASTKALEALDPREHPALTAKNVQEKMGREPDSKETSQGKYTEVYSFPGVFYIYRLHLSYDGDEEKGTLTRIDPKSVFRLGGE